MPSTVKFCVWCRAVVTLVLVFLVQKYWLSNPQSSFGPGYDSNYAIKGLPGFLTLQTMVDRFIINRPVQTSTLNTTYAVTAFQATLPMILSGSQLMQASVAADIATVAQSDPVRAAGIVSALQTFFKAESYAPQQVDVVPFPVSKYSTNVFFSIVLYSLTLLFVIAFQYPVTRLIRGLVLDKETKIRESLRVMGLSDSAYFASWFFSYAILFGVLATLITFVGYRIFPATDKGYVFLLFWLFGLSATTWCMMVSALFTKSRTAAPLGAVFFFAAYFAFFGLTTYSSATSKTAACLLSPTALGVAMEIIATYETNGIGVTSRTVQQPLNNIAFATVLGMMLLDTILYFVLGMYIDAVNPFREIGVARKWYFPVTPSFWAEVCDGARCARGTAKQLAGPRSSDTSVSEITKAQDTAIVAGASPTGDTGSASTGVWSRVRRALGRPSRDSMVVPVPRPDSTYFQDLDSHLRAKQREGHCVSARQLRKEFPTPDGVRIAVDNVNLDMFEGQIFVLLGHNGAGTFRGHAQQF
jgi:ATP-binding cassette subfamily A (ABC1) protein 3